MSTNEINSASGNGGLEEQIRGALGDLRVDRAAFAEGVKSRIGKGGRGPWGSDSDGGWDLGDAPVVETAFMRRAAGVLPPLLLPKGLAKAGFGASGAAASKAGLKFLPGLAAMPIVVVIMIGMTVVLGLRSLGAASAQGAQMSNQKEAAFEISEWWRRNLLASLLVGAFLVYVFFRMPADAGALVLLASTLVLIGIVGKLSSSGLASRGEIASQAFGMTCLLTGVMMSLAGMSGTRAGPLSTDYAMPILIGGGLVLWTIRLVENGRRVKSALLTVSGLGVGFIALLTVITQLTGKWQVEPADVTEWVEQATESEVRSPDRWREVASSLRHVSAAGQANPSMENLTQAVWQSIDKQRANGDFNSLYGYPVLKWGIARDKDCRAWLGDYQEGQIRGLKLRTVNFPSTAIDVLSYQQLFGLTDDEKDHILSVMLESLPEADGYEALSDYLGVLHLAESLGRALPAGSLAGRVEEALLATWTPTNDGRQAAFPGAPGLQTRDASGDLDVGQLTFVWVRTTADALEAMALFGVPEGVDLGLLESYLHKQTMEFRHQGLDPYHAVAAACLLHLRAMPEFQSQDLARQNASVLDTLSEHRLPLAALLLMAFALTATLRAPSRRNFDAEA